MLRPQFSILDLLLVTLLAAVTLGCFRLDAGAWLANFLIRCVGTGTMIAAFVIAFRRFGFR